MPKTQAKLPEATAANAGLMLRQRKEAEVMAKQALGLAEIGTQDEYQLACKLGQQIEAKIVLFEGEYRPNIQRLHEAHKEALRQLTDLTGPLDKAKKWLASKVGDWLMRERRERERQERELAERARQDQQRELAARAEELRKAGEAEAAAAIEQRAETLPTPAVVIAPPEKAEGQRERRGWDFEVEDPALLPREYLMPNEKAIRGVVNSLGDQAKIPGVKVFPRQTVSFSVMGR